MARRYALSRNIWLGLFPVEGQNICARFSTVTIVLLVYLVEFAVQLRLCQWWRVYFIWLAISSADIRIYRFFGVLVLCAGVRAHGILFLIRFLHFLDFY